MPRMQEANSPKEEKRRTGGTAAVAGDGEEGGDSSKKSGALRLQVRLQVTVIGGGGMRPRERKENSEKEE